MRAVCRVLERAEWSAIVAEFKSDTLKQEKVTDAQVRQVLDRLPHLGLAESDVTNELVADVQLYLFKDDIHNRSMASFAGDLNRIGWGVMNGSKLTGQGHRDQKKETTDEMQQGNGLDAACFFGELLHPRAQPQAE